MAQLTVFTPTYNRSHTIWRTYESLCRQTSMDFEWLVVDDGSSDGTSSLVSSWIKPDQLNNYNPQAFDGYCEAGFKIRYIWKENGGLHTGYNTAYANIDTELCVCIDSDDWMPDDAVEKILGCWQQRGGERYAGIMGLDYDTAGKPLGGFFPDGLSEVYFLDMYINNIHRADTKEVMRTDLMKRVAPQVGFEGEKNFNPVYMLLQVCDDYPLLVVNEPLCLVEYQKEDSMSRNIWRQYLDSPRSYSKMRAQEMTLKRSSLVNQFRSAIHYVAEHKIAYNNCGVLRSPRIVLTFFALSPGLFLYLIIKKKAK